MGDFLRGKQQATGSLGLVRFWCVRYLPRGDRSAYQIRFASARDDARSLQRAALRAERFHFEAKELQTRLHFFEDSVIKSNATILYECHSTILAQKGNVRYGDVS